MASYFTYDNTASNEELDRIGGAATIPDNIDWPIVGRNRKMLFLASISSLLLKKKAI